MGEKAEREQEVKEMLQEMLDEAGLGHVEVTKVERLDNNDFDKEARGVGLDYRNR